MLILKSDVEPGFKANVIFTYLVDAVPLFWYLISKIVPAVITTPPEFMMSSETHWLELDAFLYTLVTTYALWVVEGVGCADVNGATQYHTATAEITAIAINSTVATAGETPFLIVDTSNK